MLAGSRKQRLQDSIKRTEQSRFRNSSNCTKAKSRSHLRLDRQTVNVYFRIR